MDDRVPTTTTPTTERAPAVAPDDVAQSLYGRRQKIYPREVAGRFARLRVAAVLALLGLFYGLPWVRWNGQQAVLLDLPARKFHIFGLTLWPQDFIFLAGLLVLAALSLFFFTALAGRLWCGYACPQTVWTEVFLWMERKVEGSRLQQMRLDREPWSWRKLRIKATKHALWIAFAAWTGYTFVSYFTPHDLLMHKVLTASTGPWETFWIVFYGFATYGNAGWMREQVCLYMCPYARFQSAMFDDNTLIVSYDAARGEPRGARPRGVDPRSLGLGDCVDCTWCVQVCPTGIDIRDGLQYQCISCSACIDACDQVMDRMGYPRGLIRYTTQNALLGRPTRVLRPRIMAYGAVLLALAGALAWGLATRTPVGLDVLRDRNQLYREAAPGVIENVYTLKILNQDAAHHAFDIAVKGLPQARLDADELPVEVDAGAVKPVPVRVRMPEDAIEARSMRLEFVVRAVDAPELSARDHARFLGPAP